MVLPHIPFLCKLARDLGTGAINLCSTAPPRRTKRRLLSYGRARNLKMHKPPTVGVSANRADGFPVIMQYSAAGLHSLVVFGAGVAGADRLRASGGVRAQFGALRAAAAGAQWSRALAAGAIMPPALCESPFCEASRNMLNHLAWPEDNHLRHRLSEQSGTGWLCLQPVVHAPGTDLLAGAQAGLLSCILILDVPVACSEGAARARCGGWRRRRCWRSVKRAARWAPGRCTSICWRATSRCAPLVCGTCRVTMLSMGNEDVLTVTPYLTYLTFPSRPWPSPDYIRSSRARCANPEHTCQLWK